MGMQLRIREMVGPNVTASYTLGIYYINPHCIQKRSTSYKSFLIVMNYFLIIRRFQGSSFIFLLLKDVKSSSQNNEKKDKSNATYFFPSNYILNIHCSYIVTTMYI